MKIKTLFALIALGFAITLSFALSPNPVEVKTPLDKYVEAPDPAYKYELVSTIPGKGYTTFVPRESQGAQWRKFAANLAHD